MPYPVIGLTTRHGKNEDGNPTVALARAYVAAVVKAGGVPVLIPSELEQPARQVLYDRLDGILFTGGGDIAPERFHGEPHPQVGEVDLERDALEFSLLDAAVEQKKPFLGICRGCQMVNVGLGGTLYTHISEQMPGAQKHDFHQGYPRDYLAHPVKVTPGTHLADILGETELPVNSLHHQGVREVPGALTPVAFAPDGLVEAVELGQHPFGIAVQWHPEWMTGQPSSHRLFRAFVEAADRFKEGQ